MRSGTMNQLPRWKHLAAVATALAAAASACARMRRVAEDVAQEALRVVNGLANGSYGCVPPPEPDGRPVRSDLGPIPDCL